MNFFRSLSLGLASYAVKANLNRNLRDDIKTVTFDIWGDREESRNCKCLKEKRVENSKSLLSRHWRKGVHIM